MILLISGIVSVEMSHDTDFFIGRGDLLADIVQMISIMTSVSNIIVTIN